MNWLLQQILRGTPIILFFFYWWCTYDGGRSRCSSRGWCSSRGRCSSRCCRRLGCCFSRCISNVNDVWRHFGPYRSNIHSEGTPVMCNDCQWDTLSLEIPFDLKMSIWYLKMTDPSQSSGDVHTTSTVGLKLALTCVTALYRRKTKCKHTRL